MTDVFALSDRYITEITALDPIAATYWGIPAGEDRLPDLSPDGLAASAALNRRTHAELEALRARAAATGGLAEHERVAVDFLAERLEAALHTYDTGVAFTSLNNIASPVQDLRLLFDLVPTETEQDWANIAARFRALPEALAGHRASLLEGVRRGWPAARHQAEIVADMAAAWAGTSSTAATSWFAEFAAASPSTLSKAQRTDLAAATSTAAAAYAAMADWLRTTYLPLAAVDDAVGPERYAVHARDFLGGTIDTAEAYAWAWDELGRLADDAERTMAAILPGAAFPEVVAHLEADDARCAHSVGEYVAWLQRLTDEAIAALDGTQFDIPGPLRRCEVRIPPEGGSTAPYYQGPSEDLTRPGSTWYPTVGRTRFPMWSDVTTCYHESVPGHHLQIGLTRVIGDRLTRFQRLAFNSAHGEGWALYAERLMDELGFFGDPGDRLGLLSSQRFRAARVVIDLGLHLRLPIAAGQPFHPGEAWTPALAREYLASVTGFAAADVASEVDRYLGWPAQAITYKLGERAWLAARADARTRHGGAFDLRTFHRQALELGPLGLDQLTAELARI